MACKIDQEVRRLIDEAHDEAKRILEDQRQRLEVIAKILVERETVDKEELLNLLEGEPQAVYDSFLEDQKAKQEALVAKEAGDGSGGRRLLGKRVSKPSSSPKPEVQPE